MIKIEYSSDVKQAIKNNEPIVALESTIITHGMPWPENLKTAKSVESVIREYGATPATIAIINGVIKVGLEDESLSELSKNKAVRKLSRADLAHCLVRKETGATTVAATMIIAKLAGIKIFATGGIGGVHKYAEKTFDISADLQELSQTSVSVVCAGPKAILDIPKTLEVLETLGVPVITFGQTSLPAFWSSDSPFASPLSLDDPSSIAKSHEIRKRLGLSGGQLIANPIPKADQIPFETIEPIVIEAVKLANEKNIIAKDLTPFILSKINQLSKGESLLANIALIKNNAKLASKIALCF
ncbi:MAG: pseudouridine-5'-phosphate glycosidase [Paracoccaceae bacterium]|jgi:pseudouridine-5'-phosphate glycosidase|tara:strand:+ start:901 stop:1800 length:900 start_codon:yes stop_codon:yes gene_type:complete